jgi:hypothetical protein
VLFRQDVPAGVVRLTVEAGVELDDELEESPPPQAVNKTVAKLIIILIGKNLFIVVLDINYSIFKHIPKDII